MTKSNSTSPNDHDAEKQILLACARTRMEEEKARRIRALADNGLDWRALMDAAANHGVMPLLGHYLLTLCSSSVPVEWRELLQNELDLVKRRNLFLAAEMVRLARLFSADGMLVTPYKGPLLASQVYGDFGLRQFADLDFLMKQRDLPRAAALLLAEGYEAAFGKISSNEGLRPTRSEYQFRREEGNIVVELQTETTLRYFPRPLDLDAMSKRLKPIELAGRVTQVFSPEDTFILLAVHGAKHFWERLMWIVDIAELVQAPAGMDWRELHTHAAEMGAGRMVRLALCVARQMLDASLPEEELERAQADKVAVKLAGEICARFSLETAALPVFQRFRFRVAMREKFKDGVGYGLRLATSPTDPDRSDFPLPEGVSGVHKWLRPLLLIRRYGIRRTKPR